VGDGEQERTSPFTYTREHETRQFMLRARQLADHGCGLTAGVAVVDAERSDGCGCSRGLRGSRMWQSCDETYAQSLVSRPSELCLVEHDGHKSWNLRPSLESSVRQVGPFEWGGRSEVTDVSRENQNQSV
jgi:hypothetical protein